ncbi:MAG: GAF domain-containing SpoIIE family protein phosphatase, partial [Fidelibacterota bacterium]
VHRDFFNVSNWIIAPAILLAFFNSLKISWIAYLNKKKKILLLVFSLLLVIMAGGLWSYQSFRVMTDFSKSFEVASRLILIFHQFYFIFSIIGLLLYLPTATLFDRKMREIESLHELSRAVSSIFNFDKLKDMVVGFVLKDVKSDFCWLILLDNKKDSFYLAASRNLTGIEKKNMNFNREKGICGEICSTKRVFVSNNVYKDKRTLHLKKWKPDIRSLVGVPLISADKLVGILFAGRIVEYGFDNDDIALLVAFANHVVIAIENSRLVEESIEKERLEQELKIARDVQISLLPKQIPSGLKNIDLAATSIPAHEVGGDYYDFIKLDKDRLGIVIGDVSGKGTSAAFYMAEIKGIVQSFSRIYKSPKRIMKKVNEALFGNLDRKSFISLIYAVLDMRSKSLVFSRAGHLPLVYYDGGEVKFLQPGGIGLGLDRGKIFNAVIEERVIPLHSNDLIFMYTDGVNEARNSDNLEFGDERVKTALRMYADLSADEIKDNLVSEIKRFVGQSSLNDDITLIVAKFK